jgi:hypothetical protein
MHLDAGFEKFHTNFHKILTEFKSPLKYVYFGVYNMEKDLILVEILIILDSK